MARLFVSVESLLAYDTTTMRENLITHRIRVGAHDPPGTPALSEWWKLMRRHFTTTLNTTAVGQAAETVSGPAKITVKIVVDDGDGQNRL